MNFPYVVGTIYGTQPERKIVMYVVIKRDGRQVPFDSSKIEIAILKAMRYGSGIVNEELAKKIGDDFSADKMIVEIREIEDYVYKSLVESGDMLTAKFAHTENNV